MKLHSIMTKHYSESSISRSIGILETFKEITHERNFARIFIAVRNFIPKVFRANDAGIFFSDQSDPKLMYTITSIGKDDDSGVTYIKSVVKYPIGIGYTGKCIQMK